MGVPQSVDSNGNPYDYIIVIDGGSKGSRAHLYRVGEALMKKKGKKKQKHKVKGKSKSDKSHGDSDSEDEDEDKRDWVESEKLDNKGDYPHIELIKQKKVKPGISEFANNPKKLGKNYMGKLLDSMLKHLPADQVHRTPVFLHATGGLRFLKPEDQQKILGSICEYIQSESELYLPDCSSHINSISGEIEGLYSWIGLNYKYGILDFKNKDSTYGMLDMGGVSSQIAFEPQQYEDNTDILFKVHLNYQDTEEKLSYRVFSQSFLSGMHQAHTRYDNSLISNNENVDPCLPTGYIKTVLGEDGERTDVEGGGDFEKCLKALYGVLDEVSVDKYCNQTAENSKSSCLLSDELPKMDFNVDQFVGINEYFSNLKHFVSYKEFYENTKEICQSSYTTLLEHKEFKEDSEKSSEICFKSAWIINVLHQGVNFPRYGVDEVAETKNNPDANFKILDEYSWTLGRAVLYSFYEEAIKLQGNDTLPKVGYYEPTSKVFVYGGEVEGIAPRPDYLPLEDGYYKESHSGKEDESDEYDDSDDWDDVLEEHRLWGLLFFFLMLFIIAYLLVGRTKRQSIIDAVKQAWNDKFGRRTQRRYAPVVPEDDLELGDLEEEDGNKTRDDSLDLE